ncbi:MAG: UDP-N-acetylmuramate:L-alanyl-gamma-D-glutamyl-meso-diaminopimelate ligase [Verrucomicrobiota bacterium]
MADDRRFLIEAVEQTKRIHMIGVCGTAMGAVAAALKSQGNVVSGSDEKVYPPMSTFLEEAGISVMEGYGPGNLPDDVDVVVVGNAISRGNAELEAVLDRRLYYTSLPEIVKAHFLRGRRNLVISGTHGKTTTTAMATWLLESAGENPSFLIGGIPANFDRGARFTDSEYVVLEGDEYDTAYFDKRSKFLHYLPEVVVINNIEFDHADIYSSLDEIKLSFRRLLKLPPGIGRVFINGDDENCLDVAEGCVAPVVRVGFGEGCEARIEDVAYEPERTVFSLGGVRYQVPMVGEFNVRNAAMAICAGRFFGLSDEQLAEGLKSFEGIARRQQVRGEVGGITIIDDFAHHPTAIKMAVPAIRQRYPGRRVWAVFEPRSNTTRRNIFQDELPAALGVADGVIIGAVARADQLGEDERLDVEQVVGVISAQGKPAYVGEDADAIVGILKGEAAEGDVIAVFSNGGFGGLHGKLLSGL